MANQWLKQKSEIYAKYAECIPLEQDEIKIKFGYPDAGWLDVYFFKNEEEMGFVWFSDVYDSFEPLKEWLEDIATLGSSKASIVKLDCEDIDVVLSYEPIWFYDSNTRLCWKNLGIFSVYDESKGCFILDAICETEKFVRDIYQSIIDYALEMREKPEFVDDWVCDSWTDDWTKFEEGDPGINEIFLSKVKSEHIEEFIKKSIYLRNQYK